MLADGSPWTTIKSANRPGFTLPMRSPWRKYDALPEVAATSAAAGDMPQSEAAANEVLALPIYPELTEEQIRYVAANVREFTDVR